MHSSIAIRILAAAALPTFFWGTANAAAQSVQGTATYRERIALPPTAVFEATLEDVSRADAPAETIARASVAAPGNPPISFTIPYDPAKILGTHRYVVRARILVDGKVLFATDGAIPVITRGGPNTRHVSSRRLLSDGGIYEFEPRASTEREPRRP